MLLLANHNETGSALIQALVSVAIVSVLAAAMASLVTQQNASISFLDDKMSRNNLNAEMISLFSSPTACLQTLAGVNVPATEVPFLLRSTSGNAIYDPAQGGPGRFEKLQIVASIRNMSVAGPNSTGGISITIDINRSRTGGGPKSLLPIKINTLVTVDAGLNIVGCGGAAPAPAAGPGRPCAPTGAKLYVGMTPNCNAGVMTTNPNHLNCATKYIGQLCN